ncbi:haloacid dehalogenase type II [Citreimonas salinaria]|uniref:(S)-2-haloacid dehalogenase n=1 Tax=Citreimonas salinaria TaxID=321339 RepID=A0A1H3L3Q3_9RHOB|nr:haloacid dehalogenase type II [Citreimonas salinaria]SDY58515.1 2-haloacid dehalogenase [Citreimonas salinaria]
MSEPRNPSILVFDVNETLLDLTTLEPVFGRIFADAHVMRDWFAQVILYSEAMTLSGLYAPFSELAGPALRMVAETRGIEISDADVDDLKAHIATMPALPDVAPALEKLRDAGFRLVTLTNSAPGPAPTPLERAGLAVFFDRSFSVHEVGRFKPAPECYRLVSDELRVEPQDLCMIACHHWDVLGAQAVGCAGAFVRRPGNAVLSVADMRQPDITADGMDALADRIIAQWGRGSIA